MKHVRFAVIGAGGMGTGHCRFITERVPEATLTAVCDRHPERAQAVAEQFGVPFFADATELFQSGVADAVLIATPHYFHAPIAIEAFQHGLHVLVEKPLCVAVSEADRVLEAWQQSGKKFAIMYQQRMRPENRVARQLIEDGLIGEVRRTMLLTCWYRT
ncbi:MAG: Gfo/Idh/MocA family oxidoreductase, partial [Fimbriimonadales bacterium]